MVDRPTNGERSFSLTPLRDQLARSISRNLDLQRQLEEIEQEKTGIPIEAAVAALVRAVRSGERAATIEASGTRYYAISQLQATLRGVLTLQDGGWVLQPPRVEQSLPSDQLGGINVTLTRVPEATPTEARKVLAFLNAAQTPEQIAEAVEFPNERDVGVRVAQRILDRRQELGVFTSLRELAEVPQVGPERFTEIVTALSGSTSALDDEALELARALEGAQAAFSAWDREPGIDAAQDIVARITHLLVAGQNWGNEEFVRAIQSLAQAVITFGEALASEVPPEALEPFQTSTSYFHELTQQLVETGFATPVDMRLLAATVQRVTQRYETIL